MSVCPEAFCPLVDPTLIMSAGTGSSTMPGRPEGKARSESHTATHGHTHSASVRGKHTPKTPLNTKLQHT